MLIEERKEILSSWEKISKDEEAFNGFWGQLTGPKFKEILAEINRALRGDEIEENEDVFCGLTSAGDLVSPTFEVQDRVLDDLVRYIKSEKDRDKMAKAVYYVVVSLHLFSDGNGRTSRFLYDFCRGNLQESKSCDYFHDKASYRKSPTCSAFEVDEGIYDVMMLSGLANSFLYGDILSYLDEFPYLKGKTIRGIPVGFLSDSLKETVDETTKYLQGDLGLNLTNKECSDLCQILCDSCGRRFTSGGVALMIALADKGLMEEVVENNKQLVAKQTEQEWIEHFKGLITIKLDNELFRSFTGDDFRKVIKLGNWAREKEFHYIIDFFENPDMYKYDDKTTVLEYISSPLEEWYGDAGLV